MRENIKKIILFFLLILSFLLVWAVWNHWKSQEIVPRISAYEVHGIDVSHYQNEINWKRVRADSIDFIFIKATEGKNFLDPKFFKNWRNAKANNLVRGAYHFYRPSVLSSVQAKHFIKVVKLSKGDFPPVLDLEVTDNRPKPIIINGVKNWLKIIESHYGVKPIIYVNRNWYDEIVKDNFPNYPIWMAAYRTFPKPFLSDKKQWKVWQYTNRGRVKGIKGAVDLNVFHGSEKDFKEMIIE
jgi:lysozyme